MYFACKAEFKKQVPATFFETEINRIEKGMLGCIMNAELNKPFIGQFVSYERIIGICATRFMAKHGDAQLQALLEATVPPCDLAKVSLFNAALNKYEKEACFDLNVLP